MRSKDNEDAQPDGGRHWLSTAAAPLGGRTNPRLAQSKPPLGKGFRGVDRQRQGVGLHRLSAAPHQEIGLTLCNLGGPITAIPTRVQTRRRDAYINSMNDPQEFADHSRTCMC